MQIHPFFDPDTSTLTYVVFDPQSRDAIVIDPVMNYDPLSSRTSLKSIEEVVAFVEQKQLKLHYVLETHAHADHLSGCQQLKQRFGAAIAIGHRIAEVQHIFKDVFDLPPDFAIDGSQFDRLVREGDTIEAGTLRIGVIETPGHTPACVTYTIEDAVFTGDALFMDDYGTGRCDFPGGSAEAMFHSVHDKLYRLADSTRVFVGHDYQPNGREVRYQTTIGRSKQRNPQLSDEMTLEGFSTLRTTRDATLRAPRLLYPSVQVNIDAGRLPKPHANGRRYLRVPLNLGQPSDDAGTPVT